MLIRREKLKLKGMVKSEEGGAVFARRKPSKTYSLFTFTYYFPYSFRKERIRSEEPGFGSPLFTPKPYAITF
jgi:hypothetical protein